MAKRNTLCITVSVFIQCGCLLGAYVVVRILYMYIYLNIIHFTFISLVVIQVKVIAIMNVLMVVLVNIVSHLNIYCVAYY